MQAKAAYAEAMSAKLFTVWIDAEMAESLQRFPPQRLNFHEPLSLDGGGKIRTLAERCSKLGRRRTLPYDSAVKEVRASLLDWCREV